MERPPYWRLISVLFSSTPLQPEQAMSLVETAIGLHRRDETLGELVLPTKGRVQNLRKHVVLAGLGGPSFEAQLDTEQGEGVVRFFLNKEALELPDTSGSRATLLN
jgi:hypothetical protein